MRDIYIDRPAIIEGDTARIPLGVNAKDGYAIVDKEFAHLSKYKFRHQKGYAIGFIDGKSMLLHRIVTGAPDGVVVDHINHDPLDNRLSNLRLCTHKENMRNMHRVIKASSGFKGVSFYKRDKNYSAYITVDYKKKHLGYFSTALEAAKAYDMAALEHFGAFAKLNLEIKEK